ncbi:hypothetical protein TTHERM_00580410 (macronuclear) [Tetrahymena thermophila SB210]|uniref:Transmembrane protein n=1 Tax=Tetrahymena thermophila (strain SB210) TaxID=312017 RepID=I7M9S0_TETTS|nr:hypothetical protein TTHERM_00580410 [Tetrahymena thermophila SB210]EAS02698.2 hypothetical protein TTHERM_00580410 [Tetrahymena thermophila SB210]|eukprot:XP_001022943.2 hypothetical protein TTHERM_00580410 [Tetrahymena thermophila SB210]
MQKYLLILQILANSILIVKSGQCVEGQVLDVYSNQCFECPLNCISCQFDNFTNNLSLNQEIRNCNVCKEPFLLSEDQQNCILKCDNYQLNNLCMPCDIIGCKKCASQVLCEQCLDGYDLKNGICISSCNQEYKYLLQKETSCSYLCGLGESINDQAYICQEINKCPIYQSVSNFCHTYDIISQQTILSADIYIDLNNQEVLITYDNLGNIKFWKYQSPIINFLYEIPQTLQARDNSLICKISQKRYYFCIYFNYIQTLDLDSQQFNQGRVLNQSQTGGLQFLDLISNNGVDFLCLLSEQKILLFEVENLFNNFTTRSLQDSIKLNFDQSIYIQIEQFSQKLLIYKSTEIWSDIEGDTYEGVLYFEDKEIILTLDENNLASVILIDDYNYIIDKQTICKSQMLPNITYGYVSFNIFDTERKKYQLDGFSTNLLLRDMQNGGIIFSLRNSYSPTFSLSQNKILNFMFGAIVVVDMQKDPENEEEFINQLILPLAYRNGIFFQDSEENLYIYNFDGYSNKSIVSYKITGFQVKTFQ